MAAFDSFVFEHATVLDGSASMEPQADMSVVVERGVITRVEPTRQVEAPSGAHIVDASGAYLLPGSSTCTCISADRASPRARATPAPS